MKVEIRDALPTPPPKEVVITLTVAEAKSIHDRVYALAMDSEHTNDARNKTVRDLIDTLTVARIQNL